MALKYLAGIAIGLGLCAGVQAESVYPGSDGSAHGFAGTGTLYAVMNSSVDGSYTITGIDGPGVTGLIGVGGFQNNGNQLLPGKTPTLDATGFSFTDSYDYVTYQVNLFGNTDGTYGIHVLDSAGNVVDDSATFNLGTPTTTSSTSSTLRSFMLSQRTATGGTPQAFSFSFATADASAMTPEPSSALLLGTGLLGVAGVLRKRIL